jgi:hypothetical protein
VFPVFRNKDLKDLKPERILDISRRFDRPHVFITHAQVYLTEDSSDHWYPKGTSFLVSLDLTLLEPLFVKLVSIVAAPTFRLTSYLSDSKIKGGKRCSVNLHVALGVGTMVTKVCLAIRPILSES